jgi:ABC-type phosphate transport system substrate-binding protein
MMGRPWIRRLALVTVAVLGLLQATATPAMAVSHAHIEGTGSSWSQNAISLWIGDVSNSGLDVVFTGTGSAQGRKDFAFGTTDFGVSDIAYQGKDPITGDLDASSRPYVYLPIVAGGTAFPYQIRVAGKMVTNLRLSGLTLAKIFTNQITNWDDQAITDDNNGRRLPSIPIVPVVHSEGSGSTAQFTTYLAKEYGNLWTPFNHNHASFTEYFPAQGQQVPQNGSDGVMNYLSSAAANGAIGYDEYSYALSKGYPVAKLGNTAGYFTLPTQYNVAKSLTQADINNDQTSQDYLTQRLDRVYTYNDPRTYPLSSYSYMILPTSAGDPRMSTAKRQTLADFTFYSICSGQATVGNVGYSSLPYNLVVAGFSQIAKLHNADPGVVLDNENPSTCNNPTFDRNDLSKNRLAELAPLPPACDKQGAGPCGDSTTGSGAGPGGAGAGSTGSGGAAGGGAGGGPSASASAGFHVDPDTGQIVPDNGTAGSGDQAGTDLAAAREFGLTTELEPLAWVELAAVLLVPVLLGWRLRRRRGDTR